MNRRAPVTTNTRKSAVMSALLLILMAFFNKVVLADIYRVIDKDGNISFTDQKPTDGSGKNIEAEVEESANANTSESPETIAENHPEWLKKIKQEREKAQRKEELEQQAEKKASLTKWKADYKQAKQKLKHAEKAQKDGIAVREGDFIGSAGGGSRPSAQYLTRQQDLQQAVLDAREAIKQLKKSRPK